MRLLKTRDTAASLLLFAVALLGSGSKAALFQLLIFIVITPILRLRGLRALAVSSVMVLLIALVWFGGLSRIVQPYLRSIDQYKTISYLRPDDGNYTRGRIAGIYLAPKMIAAHPLAGIGLGNYPLVRDDPAYRQGANHIDAPGDSPSLGILDYVLQLGIPVTLIMLWAEFATVLPPIRNRGSFPIVCLLLTLPVANWFGTHLNLTYPWVCGAIALGIYYGKEHLGTKQPPRNSLRVSLRDTTPLTTRAIV
jgi:hypothetical protein